VTDSLRERFGLTRDEERHLEVLSLFYSGGSEGCHRVFLGPAAKTKRARDEAREFGWCGMCRSRAARPGRYRCQACTRQTANSQRTAGRAAHLRAMLKSNAKIRDRLRKLCRSRERGFCERLETNRAAAGSGERVKSITTYCAHCLRPLVNQNEFKVRTETCVRDLVMHRVVTPSGHTYWTLDGNSEMRCSTWTVDP
jgi:hypothetical protein